MDLATPHPGPTGLRPARAWRAEIVATLRIAAPLALTQLGQIAITTTDILVLGHLGARELAAASLGNALYWPCFLFGMGLASATSPLVAQALGAHRPRDARRAAQQGLIAAFLIALPLLLVLVNVGRILVAIGQDAGLAADAQRFVNLLALGLPFAIGFIALRSFTTAFGRTRPVLLVTLLAVALNALLNWLLVFGHLGFPKLGLVGSGTASAITNVVMFAVLLLIAVSERPFRRYAILSRLSRPDPAMLGQTFRLGLPIAISVLLETGMFSASTLLMGRLGAVEVAAHQITLQICSVTFMVPLGIGLAATIRVAHARGAGDLIAARRAGVVAAALGLAFMALAALAFWIAPRPLVGLFVRADDPLGPAVIALAASFLLIGALFQLADGLQVIAISALRGLRDTTVPMLVAGVGYWLVGFMTSWWLGLHTAWRGQGIWTGLAVALTLVGLVLGRRFLRLTRQPGGLPGG